MENVNQNKFFKNARERATKILKNRERLQQLIKISGEKLKDLKVDKIKDARLVERVKVIIRMIKSYRSGEYRDIQWQSIILLVAALVYFVTPIDLVPDFIPITGFVDDFAVIVWVYNKLGDEINKYIAWEESKDEK